MPFEEYIDKTKISANTRIKTHKLHCKLGHTQESAIADYTLNNKDHRIYFEDSKIIAGPTYFYTRLYKNNFNKMKETLKIDRLWVPVLENSTTMPYKYKPRRPEQEPTNAE